MVIKAERLPAPGETVLGGTFFMNAGGKGANQAVAAARLGGRITFIAKTGNDLFGRQAVQLFEAEGIDTTHLVCDAANPSGVALITVDKNGENCIAVASGANATLSPDDLRPARAVIEQASVVLVQLEIAVATVAHVLTIAAEKRVNVILNPAPVCPLPDSLLQQISVITPNETEASMLSGIKVSDEATAEQAARFLHAKGIKTIVITLGPKGALVLHEGHCTHVPAPAVTAVDTTAAGDVFNGALAVALSENKPVVEAVAFACRAAAISVTRMGAQASAPYRHEVQGAAVLETAAAK
jgi:ribokinase